MTSAATSAWLSASGMKRRAASSTLPWIHGFQLCTSPSRPEPVPVPPAHERFEHPGARFVRHPLPDARGSARRAGRRAGDRSRRAGRRPRPLRGRGTDRSTVPSTDPWRANVSSWAGQHQLDCSHSSQMPSATSSIQRSSRVTAAATTARLRRCWRANASCSQPSRSPSRCTRAAPLARGCGHGVPRSASARRITSSRVAASAVPDAASHTDRTDAGGTGRPPSGASRAGRAARSASGWMPSSTRVFGGDGRGIGHETNITDH